MSGGSLTIVGTGPGDPDLLTLKAARAIASADHVAFFAKRGRPGHARVTAAGHLRADVAELRLEYPYTTEVAVDDPRYARAIAAFYDDAAASLMRVLDGGARVVLLCEGDPFFYGSAMYLFDRLSPRYPAAIVPGVTGMSGGWSASSAPMLHGDDVLTVLPGTLPQNRLAERIAASDAVVIMKIGRSLERVIAAVTAAGQLDRAIYVERATMRGERVMPLAAVTEAAPYFSMVLIPGRRRPR